MKIQAGDSVTFVRPYAGQHIGREKTKKYLHVGESYIVERVQNSSNWFTDLSLVGIEGVTFDASFFVHAPSPGKKYEKIIHSCDCCPARADAQFIGTVGCCAFNWPPGKDIYFVDVEDKAFPDWCPMPNIEKET